MRVREPGAAAVGTTIATAIALGHVAGVHAGARLGRRGDSGVLRLASDPNAQPFPFLATRFTCRRARPAPTAIRRRAGPRRRHAEHQHLHDLPLADRDRSSADPADDRRCRRRASTSRGSASTTTFRESHVRFDHAPHIRAKVECSTCHGDSERADGRPPHGQHGHGVLRELPQTEAGIERLPDLSLLRARWTADNFIKLTAITGTTAALAAAAIPENQIIRFIPEEDLVPGVADVEAEHLPAVQRRLRRDRARDGRRCRSVPQRPARRDAHGSGEEARRRSRAMRSARASCARAARRRSRSPITLIVSTSR